MTLSPSTTTLRADLVSQSSTDQQETTFWRIILTSAFLVVILGVWRGYSFLPSAGTDLVSSRGDDGFGLQIEYVESLLAKGDFMGAALSEPNLFLHFLRYAVALPFLVAENLLGSAGPLVLITLLAIPLLAQFRLPEARQAATPFTVLRVLVLFAPLVLSGRTILVALGAGYFVVAIMGGRARIGMLLLGSALISFSSSAVVVCGLFAFAVLASRWLRGQRDVLPIVALLLTACLLTPSLTEKLPGFTQGGAGYTTTRESAQAPDDIGEAAAGAPVVASTVLESVGLQPESVGPLAAPVSLLDRLLTRSTIYTSYAYGQYSRLVLYLGLLIAVLAALGSDILRRSPHPLLHAVLITALGLLLEGLGAWCVLWPLLWRFTGSDDWLAPLKKAPAEPDGRQLKI